MSASASRSRRLEVRRWMLHRVRKRDQEVDEVTVGERMLNIDPGARCRQLDLLEVLGRRRKQRLTAASRSQPLLGGRQEASSASRARSRPPEIRKRGIRRLARPAAAAAGSRPAATMKSFTVSRTMNARTLLTRRTDQPIQPCIEQRVRRPCVQIAERPSPSWPSSATSHPAAASACRPRAYMPVGTPRGGAPNVLMSSAGSQASGSTSSVVNGMPVASAIASCVARLVDLRQLADG